MVIKNSLFYALLSYGFPTFLVDRKEKSIGRLMRKKNSIELIVKDYRLTLQHFRSPLIRNVNHSTSHVMIKT